MASSPVSTLSSLSSDEFNKKESPPGLRGSEVDEAAEMELAAPPSKRRRLAAPRDESPGGTPSTVTGALTAEAEEAVEDVEDISSDSSGSVPNSPRAYVVHLNDEETVVQEQVKLCRWDGCDAGDLGNQDLLVNHVHDDHVGNAKKAKYTCEWVDCKAKGKPQLSAYALRAHMRSHTKEKPFFCTLPECDKSFTRSDALAKHMRTVHESETQRVAEHFAKPKGENDRPLPTSPERNSPRPIAPAPDKPPQKLKLVFNKNGSGHSTPLPPSSTEPSGLAGDTDPNGAPLSPMSPASREAMLGPLPPDVSFNAHEASLAPKDLFRLLRRQIHWANEESVELQEQIAALEAERKREWLSTELSLENVLEAEYASAEKRGVFDDEGSDPQFNRGSTDEEPKDLLIQEAMEEDARLASKLPMQGAQMPWYRSEEYKAAQKERNGLRVLKRAAATATEEGGDMYDEDEGYGDEDADDIEEQRSAMAVDMDDGGDTEVDGMDSS